MKPHVVEVPKGSLFSSAICSSIGIQHFTLDELLLNRYNSLAALCTLEQEIIVWIDLKEVTGLERMNASVSALRVSNMPLFVRAQTENFHALLRQMDKVLALLKKEAHAFRLPELKAFVSENDELRILDGDIHADNIIGVDEYCLVTNDELFDMIPLLVDIS